MSRKRQRVRLALSIAVLSCAAGLSTGDARGVIDASARIIPPSGFGPSLTSTPNPVAGLNIANGANASEYAHIAVWLANHHAAVIRPIGGRVTVHGRLVSATDGGDVPIVGARVGVVAQSVYGGEWQPLGSGVTTNRRGAFHATLPVSGHARVAIGYWASSQSAGPIYSRRLLVRARSAVWLGRPQHHGTAYTFRGSVRPATDVLVALQLRNSYGRWITVRVGRAKPDGRFVLHQRLAHGWFPVRVRVPAQSRYDFYAGQSATRIVSP